MLYLKLICAASATIVPIIISRYVIKYYNRLFKELKSARSKDEFFYKCSFLDFHNATCFRHITDRQPCRPICSYQHILDVKKAITSAKHSILVCMYHFTFMEFMDAVLQMHNKGVKIRCITDAKMVCATSSKIKMFKSCGIPTKMPTLENSMMHHKFIIIDPNTPTEHLLFGSTNLTLQAFAYNWDHFIYTNNKHLIKRFNEEFEEIWGDL